LKFFSNPILIFDFQRKRT